METSSETLIIRDNFLPKSLFEDVKSSILRENVNWFFVEQATSGTQEFSDDQYFVHSVFSRNTKDEIMTSPQYDVIRPVLYFIDDRLKFHIEKIFRINCTLVTQRKENKITNYHKDREDNHYVGILYLNNSNGPTMVRDIKVDCVENRFVFFDGKYEHAAVQQTDTYYRVNVVFNFYGRFY